VGLMRKAERASGSGPIAHSLTLAILLGGPISGLWLEQVAEISPANEEPSGMSIEGEHVSSMALRAIGATSPPAAATTARGCPTSGDPAIGRHNFR